MAEEVPFSAEERDFIFSEAALWSIQPPIQWVPGALSPKTSSRVWSWPP